MHKILKTRIAPLLISAFGAGSLKMTAPTAFTTTMLAWGLLAFPDGYKNIKKTGAARDNIRWGTDYLLKTYTPDKQLGGFRIIYQVKSALKARGQWTGDGAGSILHFLGMLTCSALVVKLTAVLLF